MKTAKRVTAIFHQFCADYAAKKRSPKGPYSYLIPDKKDAVYLDMMACKVYWPAYLRQQAPDLF
jgi:hypothetical protein